MMPSTEAGGLIQEERGQPEPSDDTILRIVTLLLELLGKLRGVGIANNEQDIRISR
jgi:hypothetical protein